MLVLDQTGACKTYSLQPLMTGRLHLTSRHVVATVVIDLSKAFDTINHNLLIEKLDAYGIHKVELSWFSDYTYLKKDRE